jgi:hypothetical protein
MGERSSDSTLPNLWLTVFAGLWEGWKDPESAEWLPGRWFLEVGNGLVSFTRHQMLNRPPTGLNT